MEQIRNYGQAQCPNIFDPNEAEQPPLKIGTEVFDSTMPSELEFEDEQPTQNSKGEFPFQQNSVIYKNKETKAGEKANRSEEQQGQADASHYETLTKSISTFTFHKLDVHLSNPEYAVGSYIPHFLKVKSFPVKFNDEDSEISQGISKFQLLWKNVVGYIKIQLYITATTIYLLERKTQGMLVKKAWSMGNLFKVFSDREEGKARMVFRVNERNEVKLLTKEFMEVDLNLLATLLAEAGTSFKITSE